jgi:hypothetical protein
MRTQSYASLFFPIILIFMISSLIMGWYFMCNSQEQFLIENKSIPVEIKLSNSNVYYYEKSNNDMKNALLSMFTVPQDVALHLDAIAWQSPDADAQKAFEFAMSVFRSKLVSNEKLFAITGSSESLSVVKEGLVGMGASVSGDNGDNGDNGDTDVLQIKFEVLLYRLGAFEGKHVVVVAGVRFKSGVPIEVLFEKIDIVGSVFADKILLGDVNGYEPGLLTQDAVMGYSSYGVRSTL